MRKIIILLLLLVCVLTITLCVGCQKKASQTKSTETRETEAEDKDTSNNIQGGTRVLMLGRSVMGSWFDHWDYDYEAPVNRNDFTLYYEELEIPPDIANSAEERIDEYSDKADIVFFKLGFDDFEYGSEQETRDNLKQNKEYIEQVYESAVKENGKKLIIGNALPRVKTYTDSDLVQLHRKYNKWLNDFAKKHSGEVYVFDQYSILTDSKGNLKSQYALEEEDSHLNDAAYDPLDKKLFPLLKQITSK